MGGFIAAELAIAFPQRVERLVLDLRRRHLHHRNHRGSTRAVPALRRLERALGARRRAGSPPNPTLLAAARAPARRAAERRRAPPQPPAAALAAEQLRGAGKPGFLQALEAMLDYDLRERLPEIACPTLIVWGEGDRLIPVRDADVFAELIPDSRKVIFEDTGHMAMLERPAAFNALLATSSPSSAQRVTAPSAALPTSFAYFWIATSTCGSARGGWR